VNKKERLKELIKQNGGCKEECSGCPLEDPDGGWCGGTKAKIVRWCKEELKIIKQQEKKLKYLEELK
jgi:hypothetical protein